MRFLIVSGAGQFREHGPQALSEAGIGSFEFAGHHIDRGGQGPAEFGFVGRAHERRR
jgi:hypothetical protein